jgi:hypothetical protein
MKDQIYTITIQAKGNREMIGNALRNILEEIEQGAGELTGADYEHRDEDNRKTYAKITKVEKQPLLHRSFFI